TLALLQELDPTAPGLVLGIAFALPEQLPPERVARALNALVARHTALRTRLVRRDEHWTRVVDAAPDAAETWGRYCTLTRVAVTDEDELAGILDERCRRVPDLAEGPLFRADLVVSEEHGSHLAVTVHHAVADLWSIGVLATELAAFLGSEDPQQVVAALPAPQTAPAEPAGERRTQRAWRFWRELIGDGVDPLQLPAAPAASDSAGQTGIATEAADADRADALARISVH
ncbi:condensation domain-containing protein, partial [Streptomyces sp. T-3]|nr:condensation domain-containing protein [Streptomyces sp. T-3]